MTILRPLARRNFRLLWAGESVSVLGDQFYFVALSWLTLTLTGSGLALGTVLMTTAIPRLIFMLVGGAFSVRFAPRRLMLLSNVARGLVVAVLAGLVLSGEVRLWHLYAVAAFFGVAGAFFYPAFNTLTPALVSTGDLPAANALLNGTAQLAGLVGPAPAGALVAVVGSGLAFVADAVSFLFAAAMLWSMRGVRRLGSLPVPAGHGLDSATAETAPPSAGNAGVPDRAAGEPAARAEPESSGVRATLALIAAGLRYAWRDPVTRSMFLVVATVDFAFVGPFEIGLAALARERFGGAADLGLMFSAWGGGGLLGTVIAGSFPIARGRGWLPLALVGGTGVGLALLGIVPNVALAAAIIALMGLGSGFTNVVAFAALQTRTPPAMLGRIMSLIMFASVGLLPVSYALSGALVDVRPAIMFAGGGVLVVAAVLAAGIKPEMRGDWLERPAPPVDPVPPRADAARPGA